MPDVLKGREQEKIDVRLWVGVGMDDYVDIDARLDELFEKIEKAIA